MGRQRRWRRALALDCEFIDCEDRHGRLLPHRLARVALVDTNCDVVYETYVRPGARVIDYRPSVTRCDLRNAPSFTTVQEEVEDWIEGRILVGHDVQNDLRALGLDHPEELIRDTAENPLFRRKLGVDHKPRLKDLALELVDYRIQPQGENHCPIEDARAAMEIYQRYRGAWERYERRKRRY